MAGSTLWHHGETKRNTVPFTRPTIRNTVPFSNRGGRYVGDDGENDNGNGNGNGTGRE